MHFTPRFGVFCGFGGIFEACYWTAVVNRNNRTHPRNLPETSEGTASESSKMALIEKFHCQMFEGVMFRQGIDFAGI